MFANRNQDCTGAKFSQDGLARLSADELLAIGGGAPGRHRGSEGLPGAYLDKPLFEIGTPVITPDYSDDEEKPCGVYNHKGKLVFPFPCD